MSAQERTGEGGRHVVTARFLFGSYEYAQAAVVALDALGLAGLLAAEIHTEETR